MKDRGKAVEMYNNNNNNNNDLYQDYGAASISDLPCRKHPSASPVGVCPYCVKDRLVSLVCSDCGEQRLSSCSCSEISSNRNSSNVEVGSVGRISFLIENEHQRINEVSHPTSSKPENNGEKPDDVSLLKRSSSSCVEIKRKGGIWRIVRLFRKKGVKGCDQRISSTTTATVGGLEEKSDDLWVVDYMGVSRSRSLCSFRGVGFFGSEDGNFSGGRSSISGARSSLSAARSSGVNGGLLFDPDRKSGFSEPEPRKSGFDIGEKKDAAAVMEPEKFDPVFKGANSTRRVFSLKDGNFTTVSGFIDLKFDFPSDTKSELSAVKMGSLSDSNSAFGSMRGSDFMAQDQSGGHGGSSFGVLAADGVFSNAGSRRVTVSDRGIKRSRKSFKSWRWIFRHPPIAKKKDEDLVANS